MSKKTDALFEPMISVTKAARLAETSPNTIYELIYSGKLKAVKLQPLNIPEKRSNWRIPLSSWKALMESIP